MLKSLNRKKEELSAKYREARGFQKGFTLMESLGVVFIILIILGIMAVSFSFFGRVDGTELQALSKNVESAVLQVALSDDNRDIPGGTGTTVATRSSSVDTITIDGGLGTFFENPNDAAVVVEAAAKSLNITGFEGKDLASLMKPVVGGKVQKSISGKAKAVDYYVVVKKSQLYKDGALESYAKYNDELAGKVFSKKTIIDSDGIYYNGTTVVKDAGTLGVKSSKGATTFVVGDGAN